MEFGCSAQTLLIVCQATNIICIYQNNPLKSTDRRFNQKNIKWHYLNSCQIQDLCISQHKIHNDTTNQTMSHKLWALHLFHCTSTKNHPVWNPLTNVWHLLGGIWSVSTDITVALASNKHSEGIIILRDVLCNRMCETVLISVKKMDSWFCNLHKTQHISLQSAVHVHVCLFYFYFIVF